MKNISLILLLIATLALPDYLVRRITNDPPLAGDDFPTWSPDGTKIAYEKITSGKHDIWMIPVAGGTSIQLTTSPGNNLTPSWSFDGTRIAFVNSNGSIPEVRTINVNSRIETYITNGAAPSWNPDNNNIAYCRMIGPDYHIYRININTLTELQLTYGTEYSIFPDWSHDGTKILYMLGDYLPTVWYIPSNGGSPIQIQVSYAYGPKWHPDGNKICFSGGSSTGNYVIWVYDLLKNKLTQITPAVEQGPDSWWDSNPDWSPDGTKIAFRRLGNIYTVDLTQQQKDLVTVGKIKAHYR